MPDKFSKQSISINVHPNMMSQKLNYPSKYSVQLNSLFAC